MRRDLSLAMLLAATLAATAGPASAQARGPAAVPPESPCAAIAELPESAVFFVTLRSLPEIETGVKTYLQGVLPPQMKSQPMFGSLQKFRKDRKNIQE